MRPPVPVVLSALLALLVAGCTLPDEEEPSDALFGVCPQWVEGPWTGEFTASLTGDHKQTTVTVLPRDANGTALLEWDGHALDLYRITFENVSIESGRLQLRAFADDADRLKTIMDFREPGEPRRVPVLTLGPDDDAEGKEFEVLLASIAHGSQSAPDGLRLQWTLEPDGAEAAATVQGSVSAHYRVCGAPL